MIGIVATLKIQDGKNAEFEAAFKEAMAAVAAAQGQMQEEKSRNQSNSRRRKD